MSLVRTRKGSSATRCIKENGRVFCRDRKVKRSRNLGIKVEHELPVKGFRVSLAILCIILGHIARHGARELHNHEPVMENVVVMET